MNPITPGYKTTEIWLALGAAALAGGLGYMQTIDAPWAITAVTLIGGLYALLRSALKAKGIK